MQKYIEAKYSEQNYFSLLGLIFKEIRKIPSSWITAPISFQPRILEYRVYGQYVDPDGRRIGIVAVRVEEGSDARTIQRQFINSLLNKGSLTQYDAVLAAFFDEKSDKWKLSFVTIEYELTENGIIKKFLSAKRFTFQLGIGEKTLTYHKQLLHLANFKFEDGVRLVDLKNTFSVDRITTDFYNEIASRFRELLDSSGEKTSKKGLLIIDGKTSSKPEYQEFAFRLIGRLVFCWFLREKKSIEGISLIPRNLLSVESVKNNRNYYHTILEPLFFETLNKPLESRNPSFTKGDFALVPYLNGGLFSPHVGNDGDFYQTTTSLVIPDSWFLGLFEMFERYNFTIDENSTLDIDIAVEPEMLGRIFENLLAEVNPETGDMIRKATGSFYTPREIVEYMVNESISRFVCKKSGFDETIIRSLVFHNNLLSELTNEMMDEILDILYNMRIIDPACGSGAFPIGVMQKMTQILELLDPKGEKWLGKQLIGIDDYLRKELIHKLNGQNFNFIRKFGIIRNNIYGVDIQPIATEISRLRCFLSLIVDEYVEDSEENRGIKPLPNLEFKFVCANSLVGLDFGHTKAEKLYTNLFEDNDLIIKLQDIRNRYFSATESEREVLRAKFSHIQEEMKKINSESYGGFASFRHFELQKWQPFSQGSTSWFDPMLMFGFDDFDIVIGNPPYGLINKKQNQSMSITVSSEIENYYKTNDRYVAAKGGMLNIYRLFVILCYTLINKQGNLSLIFPLAFMCDLSASNLRKFLLSNSQLHYLEVFPERDDERRRVFEAAKMSVCILGLGKELNKESEDFSIRINTDKFVDTNNVYAKLNKEAISKIDPKNYTIPILQPNELELFKKITTDCMRLSDVAKCYTGEIDISLDKDCITSDQTKGTIIRGAQIQKYRITNQVSQGEIIYLDEIKYSNKNSGDKSKHNKIRRLVMQGITGVNEATRLKMTICESGTYCANSVNYILPNENFSSIEYMLGLLNSKLLNWFFKKLSTNSNVNGYEIDNLPVIKNSLHVEVEKKVEEILNLKKSNLYGNSTDLENEIDEIIYLIYELNEQEIRIIETQ